ncbi:MAG: hypothetical protein CSA55_05465 [Ilumatobacter coccineus]|uniref:Cell wall-active antibiotics response LiaF-like C-terminal domain-containing protein n=1 Tax=Ilumatobacter coccineus TaxID=467094 RepID=A0A2G6K9A0_9ACTN|nr:MAG: hypothetical protein CSA55_05465 [Ilumatobacter coccineus]
MLGIMFADDAGVLEIPWSGLLLVLAALTVVNLAVWSSISRRVWPIMVSLILVLGVGIATVNVSYVNGPVGLRTVVVESTDEIDPVYEMAIGSQTIDLSRIDRIPDNGGIRITQGIGETIIVVPDDLGIYAMGKIKAGQIRLFDKAVSGWQRNLTVESGDRDPKLVLSIEIGYGQVDVCRASDAIWIDGGLSCDGRFLPHGGRERGGHTF